MQTPQNPQPPTTQDTPAEKTDQQQYNDDHISTPVSQPPDSYQLFTPPTTPDHDLHYHFFPISPLRLPPSPTPNAHYNNSTPTTPRRRSRSPDYSHHPTGGDPGTDGPQPPSPGATAGQSDAPTVTDVGDTRKSAVSTHSSSTHFAQVVFQSTSESPDPYHRTRSFFAPPPPHPRQDPDTRLISPTLEQAHTAIFPVDQPEHFCEAIFPTQVSSPQNESIDPPRFSQCPHSREQFPDEQPGES